MQLQLKLAKQTSSTTAGLQPPACLPPAARRFSYCALLCCSILGRLPQLDVPKAVDYVAACKNFDGGFGCTPGRCSGLGAAA